MPPGADLPDARGPWTVEQVEEALRGTCGVDPVRLQREEIREALRGKPGGS